MILGISKFYFLLYRHIKTHLLLLILRSWLVGNKIITIDVVQYIKTESFFPNHAKCVAKIEYQADKATP